MSIESDPDTRLGRAVAPMAGANPGKSGVLPLLDARDAFAARILLADAAERTLDVQYYIWHDDTSGGLLLDALCRAADRGVRVRLLLDDNNTSGLDGVLGAVDAHPNIDVRLFNPFRFRRWRTLGYLTDFMRLNRRMHNKSFTADGEATIVGGRNVGDEYFGASHDLLFVDLDVLAIGAVVADMVRDFERYWTSDMSQPAARVLGKRAGRRATDEANPAETMFLEAVSRSTFVRDLLNGHLPFEWSETQLVSDPPEKSSGRAPDESLIGSRLRTILGEPKREVLLVSPYFVPAQAANALFLPLARKGVRIEVLTNSLEATDVAAVHSGYAKWRKALLRAGVRLHEIRRRIDRPAMRARSRGGSSGASLHAKTFAVDGARVFIGSFNFDPRSARLNTEMGFVIDSPSLASQTAAAFAERIPTQAYEVRLGETGQLQWIERTDGATIRHDREPGVRPWTLLGVWILSKLPIDWLL